MFLTDLSVYCVSPGWCRTNLGRSSKIPWYVYPVLLVVMGAFSRSAEEGADSIVFCAAENSKVMDTMKGKFIRDRRVEENIEKILDGYNASRVKLWEISEQLIANFLMKNRKHN